MMDVCNDGGARRLLLLSHGVGAANPPTFGQLPTAPFSVNQHVPKSAIGCFRNTISSLVLVLFFLIQLAREPGHSLVLIDTDR